MVARPAWRRAALIIISVGGYAGAAAVDLIFGTLRGAAIGWTLAAYFAAFVGFLLVLVESERRSWSWQWIWLPAVFFRLLLLLTTPTLSDDVYRYIWDGHVLNQGISPYAYAIEDPALDSIAIPVRDQANNTWMASPYMPSAQAIFGSLLGLFPPLPLVFQVVMVIFDLGAALLIAQLLRLGGLPVRRVMLYLWNPLIIFEVAHGAHIDAAMVFFTLLAFFWAYQVSSRLAVWGSPLAMVLAVLTKILPVLVLPILFWRWRWSQRLVFGLLTASLLVLASLAAGWGLGSEPAGTGLFGALRIYADVWQFNAGPYAWLAALFHRLALVPPDRWAKGIAALVILLVSAFVFLRAEKSQGPAADLRLAAIPAAAYLLFSPTVHPWYAIVLLAFLPFLPPSSDEGLVRWYPTTLALYLAALLPLSYLTYRTPDSFAEPAWVAPLTWIPICLGLLVLPRVWEKSR